LFERGERKRKWVIRNNRKAESQAKLKDQSEMTTVEKLNNQKVQRVWKGNEPVLTHRPRRR